MVLGIEDVKRRLEQRGTIRKVRDIKASTPIEFVRSYGNDTMYLFQKGTQCIITATDDTLPLILGECDKADFTSIPPNLEEWLMGIDKEITAYLQSDGQIEVTEDTADDDRISISPLIKSVWSQGAPFNNALLLEGKNRFVGCNATAMGQLLRYYGVEGVNGIRYKRGCKKTLAYTTKTLGIKVDSMPAKAVFDYSRLTQKAPTSAQSISTVSNFLAYCSKAITSDYKDTGTAAVPSNVAKVLESYFKMGKVEMIFASNGAAEFEERIYQELVNGYPVILNGYNDKTGHCFLCDGYADGKYHFNFGWGGSYDGYYMMSAINPKKSTAYNDRKNAIIVHPVYQWGDANQDGNVDISDVVKVVNDNGSNKSESDINNDGKVNKSDAELLAKKILGK